MVERRQPAESEEWKPESELDKTPPAKITSKGLSVWRLFAIFVLLFALASTVFLLYLNEDGTSVSSDSSASVVSETAKPPQKKKENPFGPERLFTKEELRQYDGTDESKPLLLAILGKVFDVSAGKQHYGVGAGYHGFAGRDGTRAFVTGQFDDEGLVDTFDGLTDLEGLAGWASFYETDYIYVGKVIGRFYTSQGQPTSYLKKFYEMVEVEKQKKKEKEDEEKRYQRLYPSCNLKAGTGIRTQVWCVKGRGRDWVGVPRQFIQPGTTQPRCACIRTTGPPSEGEDLGKNRGDLDSPLIRPYEKCPDEMATECFTNG